MEQLIQVLQKAIKKEWHAAHGPAPGRSCALRSRYFGWPPGATARVADISTQVSNQPS